MIQLGLPSAEQMEEFLRCLARNTASYTSQHSFAAFAIQIAFIVHDSFPVAE